MLKAKVKAPTTIPQTIAAAHLFFAIFFNLSGKGKGVEAETGDKTGTGA
jgi:hypothetical protein